MSEPHSVEPRADQARTHWIAETAPVYRRVVSAAAVYRYAALTDFASGPFVFVVLLLCAALLLVRDASQT
jgi:hypothetical protein